MLFKRGVEVSSAKTWLYKSKMGFVGLLEFIAKISVPLLEFQFSFYKLLNHKILYR